MLGTIVNSVAIIIGAIAGVLLKSGIKDKYKETIMQGISLTVFIIGIMGAIKSENVLLVIGSIVVGAIIGEALDIEGALDRLGNFLQNKIGGSSSGFSKGFVTTSLIYCVGAMAIVGSLESGLQGNYETLFAKSILDGIYSIIFGSTLGIGVAFSSVSVFVYQGTITILSSFIKDFLTPEVIREMSAVGGVLIMGLGLSMLEIKKIKVGNMLPAVFIPLLYYVLTIIYKSIAF